ncbi:MAG: hypothetical protein EOO82_01165 [Oxalobacteraceae bacterium]|nr:MAG: hypothetical protein EOO82_01165 [Oxalobacteraceae bacterium]
MAHQSGFATDKPTYLDTHCQAQIRVTTTAGQKPASISLEGGPDGSGVVALVMLANNRGGIVISRLVRFATGHQELDEQLGWDLRWQTRYV